MTKKQKFDEGSDSNELQALFDSISSGDEASDPAADNAATAVGNPGGDDDGLQSLFDEVAAEFESASAGSFDESTAASETVVTTATTTGAAGSADGEVFNRIGQMTRQVHNTLRALGCDDASLTDAVQAIPDARQRLNYIAQMTEQAASRVLNATDIAKPMQDKVQANANTLQLRWDRLFANQLSVDEFKALAGETHRFLGEVTVASEATNAQLMEIMMAQDFQDLTGQVIKKVVDLAQTLETELLQLLIEVTPEEKRVRHPEGLMNGPVIDPTNRNDVVNTQEQVDDLLDSLGF